MKTIDFEIIKEKIGLDFDKETKERFNLWQELFLGYNSHTNLISTNESEVLFEKHVFDSLSIYNWAYFKKINSMLDIGSGGGFPSLILAIFNQEQKIYSIDSKSKKTNFLNLVKQELRLENFYVINERIEKLPPLNVELITSRAVGKILDVYELSKKQITKDTKFLIYKSKTTEDEISEFQKKYKNAQFTIIPYELPLKEKLTRNLVILENL